MSVFTQRLKTEVLSITHKFVNYIEVGTHNHGPSNRKIRQQYLECEQASSRLILYANNWLNQLATGQVTHDKRSFYIDNESVKKYCDMLEASPLYYKHQIFADIVNTVKRLQRVPLLPQAGLRGSQSFSLSR